jgi:hypothetical protein
MPDVESSHSMRRLTAQIRFGTTASGSSSFGAELASFVAARWLRTTSSDASLSRAIRS